MNITKLLQNKNSPIVDLKGQEKLADKVYNAKLLATESEAAFRELESKLLPIAAETYAINATNDHHCKSLVVCGRSTPGVSVTFSDRFRDVSIDSKAILEKSLGKRFKEVFEVKRSLTLKKTDDATIEKLIRAVGKETFLEIFEIRQSLAVRKNVDQMQFSLPDEVKSVLEQTKPSITLRKGE